MKIAFDSQIFTFQKYGGVSRYFCSLASQLADIEGVEVNIFAPLYINNYLAELRPGLVKGVKVANRPPRGGRVFDWVGNTLVRLAILKANPDILHETYYSKKSLAPASIQTVLTVYDMIHERFANWYPLDDGTAQRKKTAVLRANHVICISEHTRRDLLEIYELDPSKVSVVHLGYDLLNGDPGNTGGTSLLTKPLPYLLYVGERARYKNFKAFLRAFASSAWLRDNFRIICFGGGSFREDELELARVLSIKPSQIEQVGGGDDLLAAYYQNAAAFVYPSLYEGFGIPTLEAMALGCPVICSDTSSIPEVVGDAGEYFNPEEIDSIRTSIEAVLQSPEKRTELIRKGFKKCTEYSWKRCANETLAIYRGLIK